MEYPKIQTLFERNEDFSIDPTRLKRPVYGTIKECDITVKMDPAVSNTQENVAAVVAMRMIKAFQEEMQ